jgi:hypothetical protein
LFLSGWFPSLDGVDADEVDAEVAQPVKQPVQLRLVVQAAGERALAAARVELEVLEAVGGRPTEAPDDDPVAPGPVCSSMRPRVSLGWVSGSSPSGRVHPG